MTPVNNCLRKQHGLTLVEILVAIGISVILITGVLQIFISSKQSYQVMEANARIQEAGRFAVNFITEDLRMAGFNGCYRGNVADVDNILNNPDAFDWNLNSSLTGHEWTGADWSPALPAELAGQIMDGTDVVISRGLSGDGIQVNRDVPGANITLVPAADNVVIGDILMVTDCSNASVFQVTDKQLQAGGTQMLLAHTSGGGEIPGNIAPSLLSNSFGPDAEVSRLQVVVYYIGNGADGEPALFRRSLVAGGIIQTQELVDGVENLQVLYGEDLDNDGLANRYVRANEVVDMANVVSARVSLLMRTDNNLATSAQSYFYDGETVDANDMRTRRVFTSTIKLRNRGVL